MKISGSLEPAALMTSPSFRLNPVKLTKPRETGVDLLTGIGVGGGAGLDAGAAPPPPPPLGPPPPPEVPEPQVEPGVMVTVFWVAVVGNSTVIDDLVLEQLQSMLLLLVKLFLSGEKKKWGGPADIKMVIVPPLVAT